MLLPRADRSEPPAMTYVRQPLLFLATGSAAVVQLLVEAGDDPVTTMPAVGKSSIPPGANVLHLAAGRGHVDTMRYLVTLPAFTGEGLESTDADGRTAVHFAAADARLEALDVLRDAGADLLAADRRGATIVHHAAAAGSSDVLRWLVRRGIPLDGADTAGRSALDHATRGLHPHAPDLDARLAAAWLLVRHGVTADLAAVVSIGDTQLARARIAADPAAATGDRALLTRAISFGRHEIVAALLDAGADLHGPTADAATPLHEAAFWRQPQIVSLLLARGAEVGRTQRHGRTPLHEAARAGSPEIAELLLEAGADRAAVDRDGRTPADHLVPQSPEPLRRLLDRNRR